MHPTVPPQTCLFWVVYHLSRTYLPKEAWAGAANRSFPLSPLPNHTLTTKPYPLYLLPLAHGPTMSYIGWVQAGGAWALRVLPFQICPRVYLLLMRLPRLGDSPSAFPGLSCGFSFGFFAPFRSWASYDNGLYISLTHLWFSLLPATLNYYSCRNNLILLDLHLGQPFIPFLSDRLWALFRFYPWAPMSLWAFPLGIHVPIAFFGLPRSVCYFHTPMSFLLTSLGFPGPITLSLSLGFMGLP